MTILSPHGEGYCSWCAFIVGLDEQGKMDPHRRGSGQDSCKGSGRRPAKRTPYQTRRGIFRVTPGSAVCACGITTKVVRLADGTYWASHQPPRTREPCDASHRLVPEGTRISYR